MANTGRLCLLLEHPAPKPEVVMDQLREYVSDSETLKNLYVEASWQGVPSCIVVSIDRLTKATAAEMMNCVGLSGVQAFVVDSTHGDKWEEVLW